MNRVFFDLSSFLFWSEDSLDNKRLISKDGVIDTTGAISMDGSDIDPEVREMLRLLSDAGFSINVCDTVPASHIREVLSNAGIQEHFELIVSSEDTKALAENLKKLRRPDDFSIFVGSNEDVIEAADQAKIPTVAYGMDTRAIWDKTFCTARNPLSVQDQIYTWKMVHEIATAAISKGVRVLGIDGMEFAGKTFFVDKLSRYFDLLGKDNTIIDTEDFRRGKEARYKGEDMGEAFYMNGYNFEKLIDEVLVPFKRDGMLDTVVYCVDIEEEAFVNEIPYKVSEDGIMILEGSMMYRDPLLQYFDMTVYMRVDYKEAEHRATLEETPIYGEDPSEVLNDKIIPAQKLYRARHDPFINRDFVIDNSNYHRPFFIV